MDIEAVRVLTTLKFGDNVYQKGKVYPQPLSSDILKELARGSEHIEIIYVKQEVPEPEITVQADENPKTDEIPEKLRKLVRRSV